jgi:hypothetical protein
MGKISMKRLAVTKVLLFTALLLFTLSVVLAVVSLYSVPTDEKEIRVIIDDSFRLTPHEMLRYGLGSFIDGANISVSVHKAAGWSFNFSIQTYNGTQYSTMVSGNVDYSFTSATDFYDAVFFNNSTEAAEVNFTASVQKSNVLFPFSWLNTPAKILFFLSLGSFVLLLLKPALSKSSELLTDARRGQLLNLKTRRVLLILVMLSLVLWLFLLVVNTNSLATFENWYTDHARHPYSSTLFTKVGFSIFDTPLGTLADADNSYYKFVTWPQMPHLYPLGSVLLFLPFGFLLQSGVDQVLVFKTEIVVFLLFSHVGLLYFLLNFWKQKIFPLLKLVGVYTLYVPLIIYSANGMFDAVPFLFSLISLPFYFAERYDYFLLFMALSLTFKYQPPILLFPIIIMGVLKLFEKHKPSSIIRNKATVAALILALLSGLTAILSAPFLSNARSDLVLNGVNAFSSHSQLPWTTQSFAVLLTLAVTVLFAVYMLRRNPLLSISALFILAPSFTMPYFQIWYLPFLFVYALIPQQKRDLEITLLWLIFMMAVLSFGGVAFNPLHVLDGWRKLLGP